ncbi:divergent polysaccharide deacetylase family protein [Nitrosophilus alvini]|uniref:divergent polysaccharide deacetylase family protein n=1 Tax=Nitrosophilus alvini TaxID=2714855 RepID=UPI00190BF304|nr:divergent polysaccharide deacetylase family protein [Nitrosophilus alvini]
MTKRKSRTSKASRKRKSSKKVSKFPILLISFIIFLLLVFSSVVGYIAYKAGYDKGYEAASKIAIKKIAKIKKREKKVISEHIKEYKSEVSDYMQNVKEEEKVDIKKIKKDVVVKGKPKLAIIIDDVAFSYQVKSLRSLNIPVNLSFFPPSSIHPNTPDLAKGLPFYMIHLPLEAKNFSSPEHGTLLVSSSLEDIDRKIKEIREKFPAAKYINNHTGSKFTSDKYAMARLLRVLKKYDFVFIDSRTTSDTVVPYIEKVTNEPYLSRDIFLDNKADVGYIRGQLKKAVAIAKKRGYAVAIGHPHPKTIEALKKSKDILKEVDLVYVKDLTIH